jgi:hypothetical protein
MGYMRSVIPAYIAIYTDAYISKPIKAKECMWRTYTYLCVIHYDHRANNLKRTHYDKEKGNADKKLKRNIHDIHMQFPKSKDADDIQTFSLACILCVENKYAYRKETRIFRILYLSFRRSSRKSYASYACSHFWMSLDLPVCITFVLTWWIIYLFFKHLPKCFSVTVKLLYCMLKAVCSAAELIVLTYFYCVPAYSKRIEC